METLDTEGLIETVAELERALVEIESKLALVLGLPDRGIRAELLLRSGTNELPDTDLVADWQEMYATFATHAAVPDEDGFRTCGYCGCRTNASLRACCDRGRDADKGLRHVRMRRFVR